MFEIFEQFGSNVNNFIGTSMYTFAMSYFCLFKVSRKTDDAFSQKMEWKLHAFIFMSIFAATVTGLASKSFNSNIHGNIVPSIPVQKDVFKNLKLLGHVMRKSQNMLFLCFTLFFLVRHFCASLVSQCVCSRSASV